MAWPACSIHVHRSAVARTAAASSSGADAPPVAWRSEAIQAMLAPASDPVRIIVGFAAGLRRMMETSGDLMFAIEAAAPYEPVAAEAWDEGMVIHRAGWGMAVQRLEALGALKQTLDPAKAADMLAFLSLPATWRTLRQLYGWTYDQIEAWLVETALTLVTQPSPAPRTDARPAGNRSPV